MNRTFKTILAILFIICFFSNICYADMVAPTVNNNGILMDIISMSLQVAVVFVVVIFIVAILKKNQGNEDVDDEDKSDSNDE